MSFPILEITTMVGCPLMCSFCPQDALKGAYGKLSDKYMSLENFDIMLRKVPKTVTIHFSGMAEPWANPHATKMLDVTLERGYRVAIYTTLYGMSVEDSHYIATELIPQHRQQIDHIVLHLPDEKMNMRGYKPSEEYREVLRNFLAADYPISAMTMDKTGQVHPGLRDLVAKLPNWQGHSRAGSLGDEKQIEKIGATKPPRKETPVRCGVAPNYDHNVCFPDGSVALCCIDYSLKHKIGNLMTQEYHELFSSPELMKLKAINQTPGFSKCSLCKSCDCSIAQTA